jgi:hypothetical protein
MFEGKKLILYELNEVPLKLFRWFISAYPHSAIAGLFRDGAVIETYTEDEGHLSPWITWPTLHRGVTNSCHNIYDFGQDLNVANHLYPPIWDLIARSQRTVGIFGSLHSYPLPHDLTNYSFYVPDTFAAGPECFPADLTTFQAFNLRMVDRSGRNVSAGIPILDAVKFLAAAPRLGLRGATLFKLASQLAAERVNSNRIVRRRTAQAQIAFDFFLKNLRCSRPDFATFFTNHVASSMHRYWPALFPDDYRTSQWNDAWKRNWHDEIPFAMREADAHLRLLTDFVRKDPRYALLIVTSMGQAPQENLGSIDTQLNFYDIKRFMRTIGISDECWHRERAMAPLYIVRFNGGHSDEFLSSLRRDNKRETTIGRFKGGWRVSD